MVFKVMFCPAALLGQWILFWAGALSMHRPRAFIAAGHDANVMVRRWHTVQFARRRAADS